MSFEWKAHGVRPHGLRIRDITFVRLVVVWRVVAEMIYTETVTNGAAVSASLRDMESLIRDRFRRSSYPQIRRLECTCDGRRLVIQGRVNSYFEKQLAQAALADLQSEMEIVNEATVI